MIRTHYHATPSLNLIEALRQSTSHPFSLSGRARRSEFWWTYLIVGILSILLSYDDRFLSIVLSLILAVFMLCLGVRRLHDTGRSGWWWFAGLIYLVVVVVVMLIATALFVGIELHATQTLTRGTTLATMGLWLLVLIPIPIYQIMLLIFCVQDGTPEPNRYGPSPKYIPQEPSVLEVNEQ